MDSEEDEIRPDDKKEEGPPPFTDQELKEIKELDKILNREKGHC